MLEIDDRCNYEIKINLLKNHIPDVASPVSKVEDLKDLKFMYTH